MLNNLPDSRTIVYSKADNLELKLNLYLPYNATGTLPAIICFHGGGLTVGDRHPGLMMPVWLLGSFD
jgi:acetyl esterase/lipase